MRASPILQIPSRNDQFDRLLWRLPPKSISSRGLIGSVRASSLKGGRITLVACCGVGICRAFWLLDLGLAPTLPRGPTPRIGIAIGLTNDCIQMPRHFLHEKGRILVRDAGWARSADPP